MSLKKRTVMCIKQRAHHTGKFLGFGANIVRLLSAVQYAMHNASTERERVFTSSPRNNVASL